MRRLIVMGIVLLIMFSLSACSGQGTNYQEQDRAERSTGQQTEEPSTESDVSVSPQAVEKDDGQHILIAYFTWAENTHVENPDEIDVDATTSASVLPPGNAAKLAGWILHRKVSMSGLPAWDMERKTDAICADGKSD